MKKKILISGAGIAGLSMKCFLERLDYDVFFSEKNSSLRPEGAGLVLGANVLRIFKEMGLEDQILQNSQILDQFLTTNAKGEILDQIDFKKIYEEHSLYSVGIHREDLHRILFENTMGENTLFDHNLVDFEKEEQSYKVRFENSQELDFDHLISCEGIFSHTREKLYGKTKLRDSGQVCWRFVVDSPKGLERKKAYEMWGDQKRVGIFPIGTHKIYCYLVTTAQGGEGSLSFEEVLELFDGFGGVWSWIKEDIQISNTQLLYNELADTKEITLQKDGVVFVGDSGHSTTPNLGQGAAMAIESAYTLYTLLKEHEFETAVQLYEKARYEKVKTIKERSMLVGKLSHVKWRFLQKLRDSVMKITPSSVTQKEFERLILS